MIKIRMVTESDSLNEISNIYEQSWKYAYRNIIPDAYLSSIPAGKWVNGLQNPRLRSLVMLDDKKMIGTGSYCPARTDRMKGYGEVVSIYLLPEYMRKGCGKLLIAEMISKLRIMGYQNVFLWVLEENFAARHFYEKVGFKLGSEVLNCNIGGKDLREIQYIYLAAETDTHVLNDGIICLD